MYAALWRALPGNRLVKALCCGVLAAAAVTVLFTWAFPIISSILPTENVTVTNG